MNKDRLWRKPGTPGGKTTEEGGCCPICQAKPLSTALNTWYLRGAEKFQNMFKLIFQKPINFKIGMLHINKFFNEVYSVLFFISNFGKLYIVLIISWRAALVGASNQLSSA